MLVGWCSIADIVSCRQGTIRRCAGGRRDRADDEPADVVGGIPGRRGRMVSDVAVENVEWAGRGIPNVYHCRCGVFSCGATRANSRLVGKPLDSPEREYEMRKGFTRKPKPDEPATHVKNYITPSGLERLKDEHRFLLTRERPAVTEVVAWAASNGDRSENADYQYGKRRLRQIDGRIRFLTKRI